jgi:hypothetical protein
MVWDATGLLLFVLWLLLPPLYVVVLGRRYARRCADAAQEAVWAREELRQALEDLEGLLASQQSEEPSEESSWVEPPTVPPAREYRAEDTQELATVPSVSRGAGRHRLDRSLLCRGLMVSELIA